MVVGFERYEKHAVNDPSGCETIQRWNGDCRSHETENVAEPIGEVKFAWRRGAEAQLLSAFGRP